MTEIRTRRPTTNRVRSGRPTGLDRVAEETQFRIGRAQSATFDGDRMREARMAAKLSQQQIADACGVRLDVVRRWEGGYTDAPRGLPLLRFMIAAGVGPYDLVRFRE